MMTGQSRACGSIGMFFALFPQVWMGLFSEEQEIIRAGSSYLRIVGPIYAFYGLGMALYFATQGLGRVLTTVAANGVRLAVSACGGALAVFWLDAGPGGFLLWRSRRDSSYTRTHLWRASPLLITLNPKGNKS